MENFLKINSFHFTLNRCQKVFLHSNAKQFGRYQKLLPPKVASRISCYFPASLTMMSTRNCISLGAQRAWGAGVREVISQPTMEAMPKSERKAQLLLQASFKLEEISDHLIL